MLKLHGNSIMNLEALQDKNGRRERPWRQKKMAANRYADVLAAEDDAMRAARVQECGSWLEFVQKQGGDAKRLVRANFCRERLCPMCAWRRSLKCFSQVSKVMNAIGQEHDNLVPLFLSLTVRNCPVDDLGATLDLMFDGWKRFDNNHDVKRIVKGWFRALEVTYKPRFDEFHPHFHVILLVDKSYFKSADYMATADWVRLWRRAMRIDYDPICDIRKIKGDKGRSVAEVAKYTVKEADYLPKDFELARRLVRALGGALKSRRLVAFGGLMKETAKRLRLDDIADGDLVGADIDAMRDDVAYMLVRYNWIAGLGNYFGRVVKG